VTRTPPELLAPAGDAAALRAALAAGADAVYLGMEHWSARAYAGNFDDRALLEAIDLIHLHGARAHLALNTLFKDCEVEQALEALAAPYLAGLDAVLVADLGFASHVRRRYPELSLHASTQLNTHSSAQLAALATMGFRRAVLARELSLEEIAALEPQGVELEVFVHGALCYGYSGLCLFSSMVGGRSGNRGRCAQACRMRYRLTAGGEAARAARGAAAGAIDRAATGRVTGATTAGPDALDADRGPADARVLSAADLAAIGMLPELMAAGVRAFKIEGRMKDASYVATTVGVYREAIDAAVADPEAYSVRPEWLERLEQSFSRGFTAGHLDARHSDVRSGGRGGHRGVPVGRVERLQGEDVVVRLSRPVEAGDVVSVYTSQGQTEPVRLAVGGADRLTLRLREPVAVKDRLFRLSAAAVEAAARDAVAGRRTARPLSLNGTMTGAEGQPARLELRLAGSDLHAVEVASSRPLEPARAAPLDEGRVRDALSALGGTPYEMGELAVDLPAGLFLPIGELRDLRRRAIAAIGAARLAGYRRRDWGHGGTAPAAAVRRVLAAETGDRPAVVLRVRPGGTPRTAPGVEAVCLDLEAGDDPALLARELERGHAEGVAVRCRPPVLLFDGDAEWWRGVATLAWDAVYARHAAHFQVSAPAIMEYPLQGLGSGNARAVDVAGLAGVTGVVASPELSLSEVAELGAALAAFRPAVSLEILAFGRQDLLLTRDRLGASEGLVTAPTPGMHERLLLEDVKGFRFPVDVDARGTSIANARVTNLARHAGALRDARVRTFLVDARWMDPDESRAFQAGGFEALAEFAERDRATTGHLFRGVK
jgi:U32 family peptidase